MNAQTLRGLYLIADPLDSQIRQVFFFDTPTLKLYESGVVARARRVFSERLQAESG